VITATAKASKKNRFGSQRISLLRLLLLALSGAALAESTVDTRPNIAPDIREDATVKLQRGDFVAVPIPLSNPTLGSGLIGGGAYFYPQTESQKDSQPASVTAAAAMVTDNETKAIGVLQQNYWRDDKWRFTGIALSADVRLELNPGSGAEASSRVDWRVLGSAAAMRLSRRITGNWYGGVELSYIDARQQFGVDEEFLDVEGTGDIRAVGAGMLVEYDTRDIPTGPYQGTYAKAEMLVNDEILGSSENYSTLNLAFKHYRHPSDHVVVAGEVRGCRKSGSIPLWDTCRLPLRGFAAFDYLGDRSVAGQVELRWRVWQRLGLAAFGGTGWISNAPYADGRDDRIDSAGVGLRFEVLPAKRLNLRLDFAWSEEDQAIYLAVGEAF